MPTGPSAPSAISCCGTAPPDLASQGPPSGSYGAPSLSAPSSDYGVPPPPPSSDYGAPSSSGHSQFSSSGPTSPSANYGTPLLPTSQGSFGSGPSSTYGVPTALPLRQPKHPVKFRPPVPVGLISSIGAKWGDSAAWGGDSHAHKFHGDTYIPPAVPDPDPGIHANQGPALVIPPPSAPPINYGAPKPTSSAPSSQYGAPETADLNPPIPSDTSSYDVQPSTSIELPSANTQYQDNANQFNPQPLTSYNAPLQSDNGNHASINNNPSQGNNYGSQDIPIKGNHGSYTLQIQPAGGNSAEGGIPHQEVLSNGLLQDILAAIENPQESSKLEQYGVQHNSDPGSSEIGLQVLSQLGVGSDSTLQQSNSIQLPTQYGSDLQHASSNNVASFSSQSSDSNDVVRIPLPRPFATSTPSDGDQITSIATERTSNTSNTDIIIEENNISRFLSENKVALYFNNNAENVQERNGDSKDIILVQMLLPDNATNSEQTISESEAIVSFKLQNAQNSENSTVTETPATNIIS